MSNSYKSYFYRFRFYFHNYLVIEAIIYIFIATHLKLTHQRTGKNRKHNSIHKYHITLPMYKYIQYIKYISRLTSLITEH